ncbi:hypothetical protein TTHERM_00701170 (macronuclear) [Tetrahymena thermophila SB210]|uniref:Uncharacterized protein n=1 Tax=Tetrahymena thermophila (strain SB210) TaxID=312017 RepID=Q22LN2_TETTS|nr:hypothetical protein TTHERM_00701170 [Tetrahymena thermophila SB210]EAR86234.1 hypothetical protein TTHERM_00701170 [Tetrahymena thermophila SB210]|eukprot:XP_976829.1 hypothetical protein TTHERM_00701170 [Tetrahymena thermophila SB210]
MKHISHKLQVLNKSELEKSLIKASWNDEFSSPKQKHFKKCLEIFEGKCSIDNYAILVNHMKQISLKKWIYSAKILYIVQASISNSKNLNLCDYIHHDSNEFKKLRQDLLKNVVKPAPHLDQFQYLASQFIFYYFKYIMKFAQYTRVFLKIQENNLDICEEDQEAENNQKQDILLKEIEDMEIVIKVLETIIYIFDKILQYMLVPKYSNKYQFLKELTISLFADLEKYYAKCRIFCENCMLLIFRQSNNHLIVQRIYQFYCDFIKFTKNIQKFEFVLNYCKPFEAKKIQYFQLNVNKNKEIEMFVNNINKMEQIEPKNTTIFSKLGYQQEIKEVQNNKQNIQEYKNLNNNERNDWQCEEMSKDYNLINGKETKKCKNKDVQRIENKQIYMVQKENKNESLNQQKDQAENQVNDKNNQNNCKKYSEIFFNATDQKNTENQSQVFNNQNQFSASRNAIKQNNFMQTHCEETIKCKYSNHNLLKQSKTQEMYFECSQQQSKQIISSSKNGSNNLTEKIKDSISSTKVQKSEHADKEEEKITDIQFLNSAKSQTSQNSPSKFIQLDKNENILGSKNKDNKGQCDKPNKFNNQIFQFELPNYHQSKQDLSDYGGIEKNYESRSNLKQKFQQINDFGRNSNSSSPESIKETSKSSNNQSKNKITPLHKAQHYSTKNSSEYDDFNYYSSSNLLGIKNTQRSNHPNSFFSPKIKNDQKLFQSPKNIDVMGQNPQRDSIQPNNFILNLMQKVEKKEEKNIISNIFNNIKRQDSAIENIVASQQETLQQLNSNINNQKMQQSELTQQQIANKIRLEQIDQNQFQSQQKQFSQSVKSSHKRFNFGNNSKQKKIRNTNTASLVNIEFYYMSDQESEQEQAPLKISKVVQKIIPDQKKKEINEQRVKIENDDQMQYQCKEIFSIQEEQNHLSIDFIPSIQKQNSKEKAENGTSLKTNNINQQIQICPQLFEKQEINQFTEIQENVNQDIKDNQENYQFDITEFKDTNRQKSDKMFDTQNNKDIINISNVLQPDDFQIITNQKESVNIQQFIDDNTVQKQEILNNNYNNEQTQFQNQQDDYQCQLGQINLNQKDSFNCYEQYSFDKNDDSFQQNQKEIFQQQTSINLQEEQIINSQPSYKVNSVKIPQSPQTSKAFHNKFFLGNKNFSSFVENDERHNYQKKIKTPLKLKSYRKTDQDQLQFTNQEGQQKAQLQMQERNSFRSIRRFSSRNKSNNSSNKFFQESAVIDSQQIQQIVQSKSQQNGTSLPMSYMNANQILDGNSNIGFQIHQRQQELENNQTLSTIASSVQQQDMFNLNNKFNIEKKTFSNQSAYININSLISQKKDNAKNNFQDSQKPENIDVDQDEINNNKVFDKLLTNQSIYNTQEDTSNFYSKNKETLLTKQKMQTEGAVLMPIEDIEKQKLFPGNSFRRSILLKIDNEIPKQKDPEQFQKQLSEQAELDLKLHKSNSSQNQIISLIQNQNILEVAVKAMQSASVRNVSYSQHQQQKKIIFKDLNLNSAKDIKNNQKNQLDNLKSQITSKCTVDLQLNQDKQTKFFQNKERAITTIDQKLNNNYSTFFDKINSNNQIQFGQLRINQNQKSSLATQNMNGLKTFYQNNKLHTKDLNADSFKNIIPSNQSNLSNQQNQLFSSSLKNNNESQNSNILGQIPKLNYNLTNIPFKSKTTTNKQYDNQQLLAQI